MRGQRGLVGPIVSSNEGKETKNRYNGKRESLWGEDEIAESSQHHHLHCSVLLKRLLICKVEILQRPAEGCVPAIRPNLTASNIR